MDEDETTSNGLEYYQLTNHQRNYLRGKKSVERPGTLMKTILDKKVKRLPERVDRLLTDIELLSRTGFFESNWNAECWHRVQTENEPWDSWDWEPHSDRLITSVSDSTSLFGTDTNDDGNDGDHLSPLFNIEGSASSSLSIYHLDLSGDEYFATEFGNNFGSVARKLTKNKFCKKEMINVLFGFITGYLLDDEANSDDRILTVEEALTKLDSRVDSWKFGENVREKAGNKSKSIEQGQTRIIKRAISNTELTQSQTLIEFLRNEVFTITHNQLNQDNPVEEDSLEKFRLVGDTTHNNALENKLSRVKQRIDDLHMNTQIGNIEYLITALETVVPVLATKEEHYNIFEKLYKDTEASHPDYVFSKPSDLFSKPYGDKMARVRTLAGEKTTDFEAHPLVTEDQNGNQWYLTRFGRLVGYIMVNKEDPSLVEELPHKYALNVDISENEVTLTEGALCELDP